MRVAICIPVFNDWDSALVLLRMIGEVGAQHGQRFDVLFVDDGSTDPSPSSLESAPAAVDDVSILTLRRNLGHQRAIAIGLSHLYEHEDHDVVIVMDGDGEDAPEQLPQLLARVRETECRQLVFAKRTRRTEGVKFRLGYIAFKVLHRTLTGGKVEVGNFSAIPRSALQRLVAVSELWNHYAAAAVHARLPITMVPLPRSHRIAGGSKMNTTALVTHGLRAISVHSERVSVRILFTVAACIAGVLSVAIAFLGIHLFTAMKVPGWAVQGLGLAVLSLLQLSVIAVGAVLILLQSRSQSTFMPLRDYAFCVLEVRALSTPPRPPIKLAHGRESTAHAAP
jgi:polyisoprenyl-phosphate glycosyltransferase